MNYIPSFIKSEKDKELYEKGVLEGVKHSESSPETRESLKRMEDFHVHIKDSLDEIKIQTKLTNGRVGRLEVWRGFITGGLTILSIVGAFAIWSIKQAVDVRGIIQDELAQITINVE